MNTGSRVALVFPGQGAQYVGMGLDVYSEFPAARAVFDMADHVLGFKLSKLCFEGPEDSLRQTENVQPAIVTLSLALLTTIRQTGGGIQADFSAGHSLGEYCALAAAGAVPDGEAIRLARKRGELMRQAGEENPGAMAAVLGLDQEAVEIICRETGVYIANYNSPSQIVISGDGVGIEAAGKLAVARGARKVVPLQVSGAFHTPYMEPAAEGLALALAGVPWTEPEMAVIANTTAEPLHSISGIRQELTRQLTHPVKWQQSIEALVKLGVSRFIEIGPGKVLSGLIKRIDGAVTTLSIGDAISLREYIEKG
jgi:[acyl-carrier-protein] S-malonyltransferase